LFQIPQKTQCNTFFSIRFTHEHKIITKQTETCLSWLTKSSTLCLCFWRSLWKPKPHRYITRRI